MTTAQKLLLKVTGVATLAGLALPSYAADSGFDVAAIVATMGLVAAAVASLGVIVLGIYASITGYRLIRKAF